MDFFENWVELDLNPIITFSSSGKVTYYNQNGQFLLDRVSSKKLYEIALKYAPNNYGFDTSYIDLSFDSWSFYALSVGYNDDEKLFVKFYRSIQVQNNKKIELSNSSLTNPFAIADLSISAQKVKNSKIEFVKDYDPSIPEFNIDTPNLLKTINKALENFSNHTKIKVSIKLKLGEHIKIENKKYSLVSIAISSDGYLKDEMLKFNLSSFIFTIENGSIFIDLPMILPSN